MEKQAEMARFADLCDRFDNLYYPNTINKDGGADHWANHASAKTEGQVHISINVYPEYVDIPASLQSVEPIENILPIADSPQTRAIAAHVERIYFAWKEEEDFELKAHKACVVKGLYGRTAAKVWWDADTQRPRVRIVDQPRNLWLGYKTMDYEELDWALYSYRISLSTAVEEYGLDYDIRELDEKNKKLRLPFLRAKNSDVMVEGPGRMTSRDWVGDDTYMVECVDYWYRKPVKGAVIELGKKTKFETWNAIFVGNELVKDQPHPEYGGRMPYITLFNTFVPGLPDGRSEFYDIEQIIREKDERLSAGGQMIRKATKGQMWQLVGAEAPEEVPLSVKPKEDTVVGPGPGNRIEKIEPFMPEFVLETYLTRLDRELEDITGLNDLLRGLAPSQVLSSSKAINALVANYEARIRLKRDLFYRWRKQIWELAKELWMQKGGLEMKAAFAIAGRLDVKAPSITPRDDLETATLALNLLNGRVWALSRAQDVTGVDDPEAETEQIKRERTDASLFPEQVTQQVALISALAQLGMTQGQAQGAMDPAAQANAQRQQQGGFGGSPMMNGTGEQVMTPPGAMSGPGGVPPSGPGANFSAQTQIAGGEPKSRLLLEQPIAPEGDGGGSY